MKFIKTILIIVVALIAIALIVALFLPKEMNVKVSGTINKPQKEVMDYLKLLKNQEQYSIWFMQDKNMQSTITGTDGTVGAKQAWNSNSDDVGEGNQTITNITNDRIDIDLEFIRPMKSTAKSSVILTAIDSTKTSYITEFNSVSNWPFNLMNFMGKKYMLEAETKNLANIKSILEK